METARLVPGYVTKVPVARVEEKILEYLGRDANRWFTASEVHRSVSGRIKSHELRLSLAALMDLGRIEAGGGVNAKTKYRLLGPRNVVIDVLDGKSTESLNA